ncbi:MAG: hypothetical protein AAFP82_11815 [Bacteroidota bacterium]
MKSILITVITILLTYQTHASSVFCLENEEELLVVKSTAWMSSDGYFLVNRRGVLKKAFRIGYNKRVKWTSKYGSVTFNQVAQDMPNGGMNEKGLVIEVTSNRHITSQEGKGRKITEPIEFH